jgi:malonyl-CoA O-methyltransferase
MSPPQKTIIENFGHAAATYDKAASMQARVAKDLIVLAIASPSEPSSILDIGCGTGLVSLAGRKQWPHASLTGLDGSSQMLNEAKRKLPELVVVEADATTYETTECYDLILSSMMLHFLPYPAGVLKRWQQWLKPNGKMYVTLLLEGSFQEWRDLCRAENQPDGMWPFPKAEVFENVAHKLEHKTVTDTYDSANDLMRYLKGIGAVTPPEGHQRISTSGLRRMLRNAPVPFKITYEVLYITMQSLGNV